MKFNISIMKLDELKKGIKLFLGLFTVSSLLLLSSCDNSKRSTETIETETDTDTEVDPETGLGDADGVGIKGSTNTDTVAVDSASD